MNNCTPNSRKNINVFHNGKTVTVGYVLDDTFYKVIQGKFHIMRKFRALFFEVSSLKDAERYGAKYVHITDSDNGNVYRCPIALIWTLGIYTTDCPNQIGLALTRFNNPDEGNDVKELKYKSHATKGAVWNGKQLSLFGEVSK